MFYSVVLILNLRFQSAAGETGHSQGAPRGCLKVAFLLAFEDCFMSTACTLHLGGGYEGIGSSPTKAISCDVYIALPPPQGKSTGKKGLPFREIPFS